MTSTTTAPSPLRVLEHSSGIAAGYAGWLLREMGAQVVRMEAANAEANGTATGLACAYYAEGKLPPGAPDKRPLAEQAGDFDFFLTDDPKGAERLLGESLAALARRHPRLVVGAASIFGLDGPLAGQPATPLQAQAASGVSWVLGHPEREPLSLPPGILEHQAGVHLADACLIALLARQGSRRGQLVDVALADVLAVYVGVNSRFYVHHNLKWQRAGQRAYGSGGAYPFTILSCKDGEVCLVGRTKDEWLRLVKAMGEPEWTQQDRYRNLRAMGTAYPGEVDALMAPWLAGKTRDEMSELADQANLTVAAVRRVDEVLDTPQLTARGFFRRTAGGLRGPGLPFKVTQARAPDAASIATSLLALAHGPMSASANTMGLDPEYPLKGLRILDLSWVWSAPWATGLLAELGAEVIKVEHPGRLDNSRMSGRVWRDGVVVEGPTMEMAPFFHQINHNKLGITLDLKDPRAIEVLKSLAEKCDVVIENMTAGAIERAGLGWDVLRKINPRLVMLSMSGAGQFGPQSAMRSYAPLMASYSGLDALVGYRGESPIGCVACGLGDPNATSHGLLALLAGLARRNATGEGCFIDLSQTEALLATLTPYVLQAQAEGRPVAPLGNASATMAPHGIYPALGDDRWISLAVEDDAQWKALTGTATGEAWAQDATLATATARLARRDELDAAVAGWTRGQDRDALATILRAARVPCAPVLSLQEQAADPHFVQRGLRQTVALPYYGDEPLYRAPWRFSAMQPRIHRAGPTMGEHNQQVFGELLGMSDEEIEALRDASVAP